MSLEPALIGDSCVDPVFTGAELSRLELKFGLHWSFGKLVSVLDWPLVEYASSRGVSCASRSGLLARTCL